MTTIYTVDLFSSLDGFGSAVGDWTAYWGKQRPELLAQRSRILVEDQAIVLGANTCASSVRVRARVAVTPSTPGIRTSITTTSGRDRATAPTTSAPSSSSPTMVKP